MGWLSTPDSQTASRRPAGSVGKSSKRTVWLAAGAVLVLFAFALRLHGLTRHGLWLDEANTVRIARLGPVEMITALGFDAGAPLYYALLNVWMRLFGESETAVRSLSVLFGVCLVPATGLLAYRLAGSRAGWAGAWLMAATPMVVQYAQETRMYTLLPLLAALAAERLLVFLETGSRRALWLHAMSLLAALYTHNWGLFLLPAVAAAVSIHPSARFREWTLAAGAVVLLYVPWMPVLASQTGSSSYRFIAAVQQPPIWQLPWHSVVLFASGVGTSGFPPRSLLGPLGGALAAGWLILVAVSMTQPDRRRARVAVGLLALVPLASAALIGVVGRPVYLLGRYEILVLPFLLALVAVSASTLLPGRLLTGVLAVWVLALASGSIRFTGDIERATPTREMTHHLAPRLQPGDRVVFTWLHRAGMEYYLRRAGALYEPASFPPEAARHQGWYIEADYSPDTPALIAAARSFCPRADSRTWVVPAISTDTCIRLLSELAGCARLSQPFANTARPSSDVVLAVAPESAP